jgi:hypothetical protein
MTPQPLNVDSAYLQKLQGQLQVLLDQLNALSTATMPGDSSVDLPLVDGNLNVMAGGPPASAGTGAGSFPQAQALNSQLGAVGGSVAQQLTLWGKWLPDMITDLGTTISNFSNINDFNTQTVQQLLNEFPDITADMTNTSGSGPTG